MTECVDIQSLFTNIPLNETIRICTDLAFDGTNVFLGLTKSVFKSLLEICVKDVLFIFNDELYKQIDGVAMGSPLGPIFANLFLCYYEKLWLEKCPLDFRPILYRRDVDDTFVIFKKKEHAILFFDYLNVQHKNIKFTMEKECNKKLSFLDLLIERHNDSLQFSFFP